MEKVELENAVRVQSLALLRIVGALIALLPAPMARRVTLALRLRVLEELRPAEAATRRLIAVLASLMTVSPATRRGGPPAGPIPRGKGARVPAFALFDRRRRPGPPQSARAAGTGPRLTLIGRDDHVATPRPRKPMPDDPVDAGALYRRAVALQAALDDLPKQARRLARILAGRRSRWRRVMRPGRPPGHRARGRREIDVVLSDCQWFAVQALARVPAIPKPP